MRSIIIASVMFTVGLLGISAAGQKITVNSAPGTNFGAFKTYKWDRAEKARYPSDDIDQMFVRSIDSELSRKGLSRAEGDADLIVTYQIAIVDDMEWSSARGTIPWVGMHNVSGIQGATVNTTEMIKKGWFILDLFDTKAQREIWQAQATKTLSDTKDPNKRDRNIQKAMAKIFQSYPPN